MSDQKSPLSERGVARRDAILDIAGQALEGRSRRRRSRRAQNAAATLAIVAALIAIMRAGRDDDASRTIVRGPDSIARPTDTMPPAVELLSDDQLIHELERIGVDAGVIRVGDSVRVVDRAGRAFDPTLDRPRWAPDHG